MQTQCVSWQLTWDRDLGERGQFDREGLETGVLVAGEWLKFEKATPDKPEVFAIATHLDIDPDAVVGKLIRVWSWFDTHTMDGNAVSVTSALLDRVAGVTGFVRAMERVGWICVTPDGVSLPNFDRHTGETAKGRALTAKRASEHRAKSNAASVTSTVTPALPREEKRREEEKQEANASLSPAGDPPPSKVPDCPHEAILALYHELLPANPRIKTWDGNRAATLRTRWREDEKRQSLDYWRRFFSHVAASPFLTGQRDGSNGRPFLPGLEWMVKPSNFAKIIENRYHDRGQA